MSDQLSERLSEALQFTYQLCGRDARKGSQVPVMAHLLGVCALVQNDGGTEDEAIAALLHDTLEDKPTEVTAEGIKGRFGAHVLALVRVATDTPEDYTGGEKPPWPERKQRYLAHIRITAPELLRVTVADKVDNVRAMLADYRRLGEPFWKRFKAGKKDQAAFCRGALDAFGTAGFVSPLLDELQRLVVALEVATA